MSFRLDGGGLEEFLELLSEDAENVRRVVDFCREKGIDAEFVVHPKAETVDQSARHTGIDPERIVKTLIFRADGELVAVMCPGDSTVDEERLADAAGSEPVEMASPEEIREETGYVIGGISPFDLDIEVYMEESILEKDVIRPAAGSRCVGAVLDPRELAEMPGYRVEELT